MCAGVHPLERLRHVARSGPLGHALLVEESAAALASLGDDGAALLLSCRRLVERQPACGPLWWLCARVLSAEDPSEAAWRCVDDLERDPTAQVLAAALPEEAQVVVLGWPELTAGVLAGRGDLRVLVVESRGQGPSLCRRLRALDVAASNVDPAGTGPAVASSALVVLEASAVGPTGWLGPTGSGAAAAVAASAGVPVWLVAGVGRALPPGLWSAMVARLACDEPWNADEEVVNLALATTVVRPSGHGPPGDPEAGDCPDVAELR